MGFVKNTSSTRCRYAACFTLGFVAASIVIAAMFWIIWCYLGLTIVQISDSQRRAVVNYSYTTPKSSTTLSPINRTEVDGTLETSLNSISKSAVTPSSQPRRRDSPADLAKGDFAARPQGGASQNATKRDFIAPSVTSSTQERKSPIPVRKEEDGLHVREISTSNAENLPEGDIKPTQTYAPAQSDPLPEDRDAGRPISRNSDDIQSSRPSYRDPDFEREPPRRSKPVIRRYDDEDDYDERGSPSRYDKRDRGRDSDDRYSKGDTRVYPDDRPGLDDRSTIRDGDRRRGDDRDRDDRYIPRDDRDRENRYRDRDREDRYRDRDRDDRYRDRGDRDREDRYKDRDDRYRGDPYRGRDDRYRDDDRYEIRDRYKDDVYREDRRRDDRYDDRYYPRDDRYDDRYPPGDDRYDDRRSTYDDKKDRYIPRDDDDRYIRSGDRDFKRPIMSSIDDIPSDRKSGKPDDTRRSTDYDRPIRDRPRTSYIDESRIDDGYHQPFQDDDQDKIYPSRIKDETYISRSTASMSLSRDDDRYTKHDDDRRVETSRYISPSLTRGIDNTRRDNDRDRQDKGGLERRSSSAEEEYRRENSRTKYYDDIDKKSHADSGPNYRDDDEYTRRTRTDDDEYRPTRPRGDSDIDRSRVSDKFDRPIYDNNRHSSRYDGPRTRSEVDLGLRKESRPRDVIEEDRAPRIPPEGRYSGPPEKDRRYSDDPPRRQMSEDRPRRYRPDTIDERPLRPAVERTSEDRRPYRDATYEEDDRGDSSRNIPLRSRKRDPFVSSRDEGRHSSERNFEDYGKEEERRINAKDVIEAALKHSDAPNQNARKVSYPVFDPRVLNFTSTDVVPPGDRRGTTIMSRRRRSYIIYNVM